MKEETIIAKLNLENANNVPDIYSSGVIRYCK